MSYQHPDSLPYILRISVVQLPNYDELTSEEPLPATVETNGAGLVLTRATRLTEVKQETTDDQ
jgi:hypothetical protein